MMLTVMSVVGLVVISVVIDVESKFHCNWRKKQCHFTQFAMPFRHARHITWEHTPNICYVHHGKNIIGHI